MGWSGVYPERPEMFTFWQQLANARLIEGAYDGVRGPGTYSASTVPGINSPPTRISNGCWSVYPTALTTAFNINTNMVANVLLAGGLGAAAPNYDYCHRNFIRPEEMWNIDTKMDDGRPGQGSVVSWNQARSPDCITTNDPTTAEYNFATTIAACSVNFLLQ